MIGNALTDTLRTDINVGTSQINLTQTLFTLAFVIFEIPMNLLGKRLGPHRWLPFIMFFWGLAT